MHAWESAGRMDACDGRMYLSSLAFRCLPVALALAWSIPALAADLWMEDFESYTVGTGIDGTGNLGDYPGSVSKWSLDVSGATLDDAADYVKTVSGVGLECRDMSGFAVWESESIDISGYAGVGFSLNATEDGDHEGTDYINVEYSIGGGDWTLITNWNSRGDATHTLKGDLPDDGDWVAETVTKSGLSGSSLKIRVTFANGADDERFQLDDIFVTGTPELPAPVIGAASATNSTSFTAEWTSVPQATGYLVDVATNDAFTPSGSDVIAEGFEGTWPPAGWTQNSVDQSSTYAHDGTLSAQLGAAADYLITPEAALPGTLTFWSYTTPSDPSIVVELAGQVGGPWSEVAESPFSGDTEQWNERSVDLSSYSDVYIRFTKSGTGTLYVDGVNISDLGSGDFVPGYESRPVAGSGTTSTSVTGLTMNTTYYYRVRATNATHVSINSDTSTVQTLDLQAPTALASTWTNAMAFTSAWTSVDGAAGYYLDVATNSAFKPSTSGDVLISEMCDPANGFATNRFLEIYNAGGTAVDLAGWSLVAIGNALDIFTWELSGKIGPGEALVCGDDAASTVGFTPDFEAAGWSENNSTWNGGTNDGARLLDAASNLVDLAYTDDDSGDETVYRNPGIATARTSYVEAEWTDETADYATDGTPGVHTCNFPDWTSGDFVAGYESLDVGNVTEYAVTGLVAFSTYHYRVRAYYGASVSDNSNTQSVETVAYPEPENHVTGFVAGPPTHRTIVLSWTDATGENLPDRYLIRGSTVGQDSIPDPVDGNNVANDSDWSDGTYAQKVNTGEEKLSVTDLDAGTSYHFKIYPAANADYPTKVDYKTNSIVPAASVTTLVAPYEDFEDVSQGSYLDGALTLGSGDWLFNDALLGFSASDKRNDQQSLRIKEGGSVEFDKSGSAGILTFRQAAFGTDGGCRFEVYRSTDEGASWIQVGSEINCGAALSEESFTINKSGNMRLMITNTVMSVDHRINIDDLAITDYTAPPRGALFKFR